MSRTNNNKEIFEIMPVPKAVQTMAIPTIIGQLIVLFYNMADTFFVGRTNNPLMVAGASLILPVFNITLSVAGLAGIGGGALISRLLGRKEPDEACRVFRFSVALAVGMALVFSAGVMLWMEPLLHALGAGPDVHDYARQYALCVIVFGGLPTVLANTLANLLRATGESKKAAFGVTMGGLVNIVLDPLFMFVLFPRGMEIMGAGAATCVSNCLSCVYFVLTIRRLGPDTVLRFGLPAELPRRENIGGIFGVGVPSSIATLLFDLDYVVIGRLMSGYSSVAVAAIGIVLKVERLPLNIGIGICQGMMPIVAYNYAAKNVRRMDETRRFSRMIGLVCAGVSVVLYELFAGPIMSFFIGDAQTVALGTDFLRVRVLATPLMFLSFFHVHLFNGFGRGREALFLGVTRWAVLNIPMLFLLNWLVGMYGIVWSQITADIFTVALSFYVYERFRRQQAALMAMDGNTP